MSTAMHLWNSIVSLLQDNVMNCDVQLESTDDHIIKGIEYRIIPL